MQLGNWLRSTLSATSRRERSPVPRLSDQGQAPSNTRAEATSAFARVAEKLAEFHAQRADAFERKAVGALGFTGLAMALIPVIVTRVDKPWDRVEWNVIVCTIVAVVLLALSAVFSAATLLVRRVSYPSAGEFRDLFIGHEVVRLDLESVEGAWAKALFGVAEHQPLADLRADAAARGTWFSCAVLALVCGVVSLGGAVALMIAGDA